MKFSALKPSKYFKKEDVPQPIVATIEGFDHQEIRQGEKKETKAVMLLRDSKAMVLNVTNLQTLEVLFGDTEAAVGKQIEIYTDPNVRDQYQKVVGGLRLRAPANAALAWPDALKQCAAAGLTEDQVKQALKESGRKAYNPKTDGEFIRQLISDAQGGGAGDEIPI